jgi:hypothetical protein
MFCIYRFPPFAFAPGFAAGAAVLLFAVVVDDIIFWF